MGGGLLALAAAGIAAIGLEALVRARLGPPESRVPTTLLTRPTAWGGSQGPVSLPLAPFDGSPPERRLPVRLDDLPAHLIEAVLAVEDQRFPAHSGLDLRRIGGALVANVRARRVVQGGSTLTQQLAKNLYLSNRRTPLRKAREAAMALMLEARYGKPVILEAYLNEIYLGQDRGLAIHGVGAGARHYFGKEASRLTLAESALLAGMISAPNRYAPTRNPDAARARRNLVLQQMALQGRVSAEAATRAQRAALPSRTHDTPGVDGRWFRDFAGAQLPDRRPARGLAIHTTLDARLQRAAERSVREGLDRLRLPGVQGALVALDPRTGEVLAMVGGRDYGASQFNRATRALRQPGSAFKPVVALAALERRGDRTPAFTLASRLDDTPFQVTSGGVPWQPANYDGQFRGSVTLREAMEQSFNVPFARIGLAVGPERIAATARQLGVTSPMRPVPSLALGSSEVTLLELARAYGVLAAGGQLAETRVIHDARTAHPRQVVDPASAYLVTSTLEGALRRGTGRALGSRTRFAALAGKTGTSNGWRDAWFVAYSPTLVVAARVGFDDGRSLNRTGAAAALPIVAAFLEQVPAAEMRRRFARPEGVTEAYVGGTGGWFTDCGERELFLEGTEPEGIWCWRMEAPPWEQLRRLGNDLGRRAARMLERVLAEAMGNGRGAR